jgi:hypothetical protein
VLLLTEGQMSDHKGARIMLDALPPASTLRIPMKSAGDSDRIQPPVPIEGSRGFR